MAGFADAFDTSTGGDFVGLGEFVGSVIMIVPIGYRPDQPSKYARQSDGALLNDVALVDVITVAPGSDDTPKEVRDMWISSAQPRAVVSRGCRDAQAGRQVKPILKLVDSQPMKNDRTRLVYGLTDVTPDRPEVIAMIRGHRDMTVSQVEQAVAALVGKIQEKAYQEWLDYSQAKTARRQESARQVFEVAPDQPQRFEARPQVTDDPWN
jgi:hypothetical protein